MNEVDLFIEHVKSDIADKKRFLEKLNNGESLLEEEPYIRQWYKTFDNI